MLRAQCRQERHNDAQLHLHEGQAALSSVTSDDAMRASRPQQLRAPRTKRLQLSYYLLDLGRRSLLLHGTLMRRDISLLLLLQIVSGSNSN